MRITEFYEKIRNISLDYHKQGVEKDVLIGEFLEHYYTAIIEQENSVGRVLISSEEENIFNTLISKSSINSINDVSTNAYIRDKDRYIVKDTIFDLLKKFISELLIKALATFILILVIIYFFREPIINFLVEIIKR